MSHARRKTTRKHTLINIGVEKNKRPHMTPEGRILQYHVISLITRGEGTFTDAHGVTTPVKAGTAIYQFPEEWHCFDPYPKQTWAEYWIVFDGVLAEERFGNLMPKVPGAYSISDFLHAQESWQELLDILELHQPGYEEYAEYLVHDILMNLYRQCHQLEFMRMDDDIVRLRQQMRSQMNEATFSVTAFAQSIHLGYDQLRKRFRISTGMSPKSYFLQLKINRAKELLLQPGLTIKEIASQLGFDDPYYFSRLFTRRCGISPLGFRNDIIRKLKT